MKVAILAASGRTGRSIVNGLLASPDTKFEITALIRPSSLSKPETTELKDLGVNIAPVDLEKIQQAQKQDSTTTSAEEEELVKILTGTDVVISAVFYLALGTQTVLADASKKAGVKRFVPCSFQTVVARGAMGLMDEKLAILDYVQRIRLPYTHIDVGWWYQIGCPRVPSGKLDKSLVMPAGQIIAGGNTPSAITDMKDVGRYVAKIVADERTINNKVFCWGDVKTQNEIWEVVRRVSGEDVADGQEIPAESIAAKIAEYPPPGTTGRKLDHPIVVQEYWNSCGVRGDNTPENAKYLGYLLAPELYPDFKARTLEKFVQDGLAA